MTVRGETGDYQGFPNDETTLFLYRLLAHNFRSLLLLDIEATLSIQKSFDCFRLGLHSSFHPFGW